MRILKLSSFNSLMVQVIVKKAKKNRNNMSKEKIRQIIKVAKIKGNLRRTQRIRIDIL